MTTSKRRGKPTKGETPAVAFRLPATLIERIDRHVRRLRLQHPGMAFSRTDALRELLSVALDVVEKQGGR
jgi:hypothetical protein